MSPTTLQHLRPLPCCILKVITSAVLPSTLFCITDFLHFSMKNSFISVQKHFYIDNFLILEKVPVILTSLSVANLFPCFFCYKILESVISTHCLQFPFYHSLLKSPSSILWPHQSTETALTKFAKDLHIAITDLSSSNLTPTSSDPVENTFLFYAFLVLASQKATLSIP